MIRVTRSVRAPDGRSQSLSVLKENVLGLQIFLVENLDYGKNNLGHILPIKLSEVLWDKEIRVRESLARFHLGFYLLQPTLQLILVHPSLHQSIY